MVFIYHITFTSWNPQEVILKVNYLIFIIWNEGLYFISYLPLSKYLGILGVCANDHLYTLLFSYAKLGHFESLLTYAIIGTYNVILQPLIFLKAKLEKPFLKQDFNR